MLFVRVKIGIMIVDKSLIRINGNVTQTYSAGVGRGGVKQNTGSERDEGY